MRSPILLAALVAMTSATAFAQDLSDGSNGKTKVDASSTSASASSNQLPNAYAQELYSSGETKHNFGRVLSWGGLALSIAGNAAGNSTLNSVGGLAMLVGIPVNGSGSSDMVDAANAINPKAAVEMRGWGTYTASWALMGGGVALLLGAVANDNVNMLIPAVVCIITGDVLQYVAWGQFSASADRAGLAKNTATSYKLELAPVMYASKATGVMPGMQLALRF